MHLPHFPNYRQEYDTTLQKPVLHAGADTTILWGQSVQLGDPDNTDSLIYRWGTADSSYHSDEPFPVVSPDDTTTYYVQAWGGPCLWTGMDSITVNVVLPTGRAGGALPLRFLTYPNPADESVQVRTNLQEGETAELRLISMVGQTVRLMVLKGPNVMLPLADVPAGSYVVSLTTADGRLSRQQLLITH